MPIPRARQAAPLGTDLPRGRNEPPRGHWQDHGFFDTQHGQKAMVRNRPINLATIRFSPSPLLKVSFLRWHSGCCSNFQSQRGLSATGVTLGLLAEGFEPLAHVTRFVGSLIWFSIFF